MSLPTLNMPVAPEAAVSYRVVSVAAHRTVRTSIAIQNLAAPCSLPIALSDPSTDDELGIPPEALVFEETSLLIIPRRPVASTLVDLCVDFTGDHP